MLTRTAKHGDIVFTLDFGKGDTLLDALEQAGASDKDYVYLEESNGLTYPVRHVTLESSGMIVISSGYKPRA